MGYDWFKKMLRVLMVGVNMAESVFTFTTKDGSTGIVVKDSDGATVAGIDSNGVVTGSSFVGPVTGTASKLPIFAAGALTAACTQAELVAICGVAATLGAGTIFVVTANSGTGSGKTYLVVSNGTTWDYVLTTVGSA